MAQSTCLLCQLPIPEGQLVTVGGKSYCSQCRGAASDGSDSAAQASTDGTPAQADKAPRITLPLPGKPLYYEHSGRIGFLGPLFMSCGALAVAGVLGFVYAYLVYWNPFIYVNAIACAALGICLGMVNSKLGVLTDMRSSGFAAGAGLAAGLCAVYWAWAVWLMAHTSQFAWNPLEIWVAAGKISIEGLWSLKGIAFKGTPLQAVWAAEALVILACSTLISWSGISEGAFCERCGDWLKKAPSLARVDPFADRASLLSLLQAGDFSGFEGLQRAPSNARHWMKIELLACNICRQLFCLRLIDVHLRRHKDSEQTEEETVLVDKLLVDSSVHDWILKRFS